MKYGIKLESGEVISQNQFTQFVFTDGDNKFSAPEFLLIPKMESKYLFITKDGDLKTAYRLIKSSSIVEYFIVD